MRSDWLTDTLGHAERRAATLGVRASLMRARALLLLHTLEMSMNALANSLDPQLVAPSGDAGIVRRAHSATLPT